MYHVKWHLARFATEKLTLPRPLLNGFLEELAGGGVVMVKSLLSQLLHPFIYCNPANRAQRQSTMKRSVRRYFCAKRQEVMLCNVP
eukprot:scaffold10408_cov122-Skeletonema_dohrnii-CCMP3373.AAC.7